MLLLISERQNYIVWKYEFQCDWLGLTTWDNSIEHYAQWAIIL